MRDLFEIDLHDYDINGTTTIRPSSRAIIIKDNKLAMIYSKKYKYYKFPGGGINHDESNVDALIRETKEETGLIVIPESIKEFGKVHRIHKGDIEDVFIQDNFYYLCDVKEEIEQTSLDDYEQDEGFTLQYVTSDVVIKANTLCHGKSPDDIMLDREIKIINILKQEALIK